MSLTNTRSKYWKNFKLDFDRKFENAAEETRREKIFWKNLKRISHHNFNYRHGSSSYKIGINQFSDMTFHEYAALFTANETIMALSAEKTKGMKFYPERIFSSEDADGENIPETFDWREKGAVTPINDQKKCGSCYAMSSLGAVESHWFIRSGKLIEMSEQEIIDCSIEKYLGLGCSGGIAFQVFEYVKDNAISSAADYPYEAVVGECRPKKDKIHVDIEGTGYVDTGENGELALMAALSTIGPIAISIDLKHESFMRYSGGVYFEANCTTEVNHGALLVGYGTESDEDFWIIKNSFGETWGEGGYMRMSRKQGNGCGIMEAPIFPVFKEPSKLVNALEYFDNHLSILNNLEPNGDENPSDLNDFLTFMRSHLDKIRGVVNSTEAPKE